MENEIGMLRGYNITRLKIYRRLNNITSESNSIIEKNT